MADITSMFLKAGTQNSVDQLSVYLYVYQWNQIKSTDTEKKMNICKQIRPSSSSRNIYKNTQVTQV